MLNDRLTLELSPKLPGWLFKEDGTFSFRFLGTCDVSVYNPDRKNTYDLGMIIKTIKVQSDGRIIEVQGPRIEGALAERVRSGEIRSVELFYE
jgi:hypothetical protein